MAKIFQKIRCELFFDKIIQVPFHLPLGAYDVDNLLVNGLKSIGVDANNEDLEIFGHLAQNSVGRNPRSIKRLVNTFGLIKTIGKFLSKDDHAETRIKDIHIFSILCMQISYPQIFNELTGFQDSGEREKNGKKFMR